MCSRWLPCPGNRKATEPGAAASAPPVSDVGREHRAGRRVAGGDLGQAGAQVVEVVGDDRHLDRAPPAAGGGHGDVAQTATAVRPRRRRRAAPGGRARPSAAVVGRRAAGRRTSSAGHSSRPWAGSSPRVYAERTVWKLVPPKPKALTPARRSSSIHGRATSLNTNGLFCSFQASLGRVTCSVGGSTPRCRAWTALMIPAMPAAHFVWPIWDLTDPSVAEAGSAPSSLEHLGERGHLGAVADDRAGAVGLHQADRRRRCPGLRVRPLERELLALLAGAVMPEARDRRWTRRRPR